MKTQKRHHASLEEIIKRSRGLPRPQERPELAGSARLVLELMEWTELLPPPIYEDDPAGSVSDA